jgi:hypothetical protein
MQTRNGYKLSILMEILSTLLDIYALTQNAFIAARILIQSLALSFRVKMHLTPTVSRYSHHPQDKILLESKMLYFVRHRRDF